MINSFHASHAAVARRLRRVGTRIRSMFVMLLESRPCLDPAQPPHAAEPAVGAAKRALIRDHMDHRLDAAAGRTGARRRACLGAFKPVTRCV